MQLAARRPHISAGVALASAAVLAAGPMTQHLPKLDVAQHMPQVSVTDINLTDAASSMVDLFAGVESQLAALAGGAATAAAVPASVLSDVSPYAVNPFNTWGFILYGGATNLQKLGSQFNPPMPVLQQIAANGIQYTSDILNTFVPTGNAQFNAVNAGSAILQNLISDYHFWSTGPGIADAALGITGMPAAVTNALGASLQNIYNAASAGDALGVVTQTANIPGSVANAVINGFPNSTSGGSPVGGLLSSVAFGKNGGAGVGYYFANLILPQWAQAIAAPGAQNIEKGGSLAVGLQNLGAQLQQTGANIAANVENLPSAIANVNPQAVLNQLQGFAAGLANVTNIEGDFNPPFPVLQQIVANGLSYIGDYVTPYKTFANNVVNYYGSAAKSSFTTNMIKAWGDLQTGKISAGLQLAYQWLFSQPMVNILEPLENTLTFPQYMLQNVLNSYKFFTTPGQSLSNLLPNWSSSIVAPGAVNIQKGGTLAGGATNLQNTLTQGWPALASIQNTVNQLIGLGSLSNLGTQLTALLQSVPSALANLPSAIGGFVGTLSSQIGTLLINLLRMF